MSDSEVVAARLKHSLMRFKAASLLLTTLETVLDSAYDGIIVIDETARVHFVNQAMAERLRVKQEEIIGRLVSDSNTRG